MEYHLLPAAPLSLASSAPFLLRLQSLIDDVNERSRAEARLEQVVPNMLVAVMTTDSVENRCDCVETFTHALTARCGKRLGAFVESQPKIAVRDAKIAPTAREFALLPCRCKKVLHLVADCSVHEIRQKFERQVISPARLHRVGHSTHVQQHALEQRPLKLVEERGRSFVELVQSFLARAEENDVIVPSPEEPHTFVPQARVDRAESLPHERDVSLLNLFVR